MKEDLILEVLRSIESELKEMNRRRRSKILRTDEEIQAMREQQREYNQNYYLQQIKPKRKKLKEQITKL